MSKHHTNSWVCLLDHEADRFNPDWHIHLDNQDMRAWEGDEFAPGYPTVHRIGVRQLRARVLGEPVGALLYWDWEGHRHEQKA